MPTTNPTHSPTTPAAGVRSSGVGIGMFYFVNAATNQDIGLVHSCDGCFTPSTSVNIRVDTFGNVKSVKLTLEGPIQFIKIENVAPYALFGDKNGVFNGKVLTSGSYTVTAQAFSELDAGGLASDIKSVSFTISPPTPLPTSMPTMTPTQRPTLMPSVPPTPSPTSTPFQQLKIINCGSYTRRRVCLRQRQQCLWDGWTCRNK